MFGRLVRVTGTVLMMAVAFVTPVLVTSTTRAAADTVIDGCTIVSNPTPTNFTNCPNTGLAGANLSGLDLSYANLAGDTFADCPGGGPLPACDLTDLSGANLTDADLSGAIMFSILEGTPTMEAQGSANLSGANLTGANLSQALLVGVSLNGAPMTGANLTTAILSTADLTDADLTDANLSGASATFCVVSCLSNANFTNANLTGATFSGTTDLTGVTLTGANFTGTTLVPSNQTVTATSQAGAVATWSTPAAIPGATPGSCTPASGSTFPLFGNTVTCQVLDASGDVATGTFQVLVEPTTQYFTRVIIPSDGAVVPTDGPVVQGNQILDALAGDAPGITSVTFELSGGTLGSPLEIATAAPTIFGWLAEWNPSGPLGVNNGTYTLQSVATDAAGNTDTSAPITITVNNPPTVVAIVGPANGTTVSGSSVGVSATVSNPEGGSVQFFVSSQGSCGTTTPYGPYCYSNSLLGTVSLSGGSTTATATVGWNTLAYGNGTYTIQADAVGGGGPASTSITVTVDNPLPETLIPSDGVTQSGSGLASLLDAVAPASPSGMYVTFVLSGGTLGNDYTIATGAPTIYGWLAEWDTTTVPNGTYSLQSVAWYGATAVPGAPTFGVLSAPITITVNNP